MQCLVFNRPGRHFCQLGQLASEVGWKYQALIKVFCVCRLCDALSGLLIPLRVCVYVFIEQKLEENRKTRAKAFFEKKQAAAKLVAAAVQKVESQ